jgi:hypothetical protein
MSENLDLVRSIGAAWEGGDFSSAEWADPGIEVVVSDGPSPRRWSGLAGMAESEREFLNAWENYSLTVDEFRELDGDRALLLVHHTGRGKTSGLELSQMQSEGAVLFHISGGKVNRLTLYWNRNRALADLGLEK